MSENNLNNDGSILPGMKPVLEKLRNAPEQVDTVLLRKGKKGKEVAAITDICRKERIRFNFVAENVLEKMFDGNHQGVIARIFESGFVDEDDVLQAGLESPLQIVLMLDQVQDPGNAGTLARSLFAIGAGGMIVPKHNASFLGSAAAKASAGALSRLPVAKATNLSRTLERAIDMGYTVYGAQAGEESQSVFSAPLNFPAILVLGNEEKGIRPNVAKRLDVSLKIPMLRDFDSLNVAQAGAMLLSAFLGKQQG